MRTTDTSWQDALRAMLPEDFVPEPDTPSEGQSDKSTTPKPLLSVSLDRKRAGKTATIISGFDPDDPAVDEIAKMLRRQLAVGGSARGGEILLQGDFVTKTITALNKAGYKTKKI